MFVHFEQMAYQLTRCAAPKLRLHCFEQMECAGRVHLQTTVEAPRNFGCHLWIARIPQLVFVHVDHSHLGVGESITHVIHPRPFPQVVNEQGAKGSGQQFVFAFEMRQGRADGDGCRTREITCDEQPLSRPIHLRPCLAALLFGQLDHVIHDPEVAFPYLPRVLRSVLLAETLESTLHKIDRAACPIPGAADSEPQQADSQARRGLLVPSGAVTPSDIFDVRNGHRYGQADQTRGMTTPAGGR